MQLFVWNLNKNHTEFSKQIDFELKKAEESVDICIGKLYKSLKMYTERKTQVASSLLQACYLAVIKPISGYVRIACSGLMITSLRQVINRLDASLLSRLFIHNIHTSCFDNLQQVASNLISTDLMQFDEVNRLDAMDRLPYRQKFLNDRNSKICYHSLKDHPKVSKIAKFRCEMF